MLALQVDGFSHRYKNHLAVDGLNLVIAPGEIYGLIGPDGAGKTTTLRVCAGVSRPTQGTVRVFGSSPMDIESGVRANLGYMPQRHSLYGDLSIEENLRFFGELFGISREQFIARSERLLAITHLGQFRSRRADALSGGMYKKLALSCALLHQPRLLVLDEPTNGVDPISRLELFALLAEFAKEGMAALVSTTYMDEATRCNRVGLLHQGRLIAEGTLEVLLAGFLERVVHIECKASLLDRPLAGVQHCMLSLSPMGRGARAVVVKERLDSFLSALRAAGIEFDLVSPSLEDVFFTLAHQGGSHG